MKEDYPKNDKNRKPAVHYENGRFYFTKETERSFYFILTLMMLVAGILYKTGIL